MVLYQIVVYYTILWYTILYIATTQFSFRYQQNLVLFPIWLSCYNRIPRSGPRWWSITLLAVVNSLVTAPFPSMPGRSGAWSPIWRRSLPLMILAKPKHLPPPAHCSLPCGPTFRDEPCRIFTVYCISSHYWCPYNFYYSTSTCSNMYSKSVFVFLFAPAMHILTVGWKPCTSTSAFQKLKNSLDFTLESWDSSAGVKSLKIHFYVFTLCPVFPQFSKISSSQVFGNSRSKRPPGLTSKCFDFNLHQGLNL